MIKKTRNGKVQLLEAAHKAFGQNGYDQVGVAQILSQAGVQAPTLYHHFGDKEGLYTAWACGQLEDVRTRVSSVVLPSFSTFMALQAFTGVLSQDMPLDVRQLLKDAERLSRPESREQVLDAFLQAIYDPLYAVLVRGKSKGDLKPEPMGLLAETFIAGALALGKHGWRSAESSEDGAAWWARIFLQGCAADRPGA